MYIQYYRINPLLHNAFCKNPEKTHLENIMGKGEMLVTTEEHLPSLGHIKFVVFKWFIIDQTKIWSSVYKVKLNIYSAACVPPFVAHNNYRSMT